MDLRRTDLGLLLALDALLAEQSVTRAAERLGISQPALSAQLARLRDLFGDPLLVQAGTRMTPTPRAAELHAPLHQLLDELQALVRGAQAFDPATSDRVFRIAATDNLHRVCTGALAGAVATAAPGIRLALLAFDARAGWDQLDRGEADLLIASARMTPAEAIGQRLYRDEFVFVQRKGHPRGTGPVDLDQFCALDHVLVSPDGGGFAGATDEALAAIGRRRRVVISLPSFLLVAPLITANDFVAVMPRRLARLQQAELDLFPTPVPIPGYDIHAAWHPRHQRDPAHAWLRRRLAEVAA